MEQIRFWSLNDLNLTNKDDISLRINIPHNKILNSALKDQKNQTWDESD